MFRYIALWWPSDSLAAQQTAMQLTSKLRAADSGWEVALPRRGFNVFTTGARPRINTAYVFPLEDGVILGKLFRRFNTVQASTPVSELTAYDATQIMESRGHALIESFWGRYVALLNDVDSGGVRVLRDPSGALPCHLLSYRGVWIVFSWLEDIFTWMPSVPVPSVNWDYIAVHVPSFFVESHETGLDGVSQLVGGEAALVNEDGIALELYWNAVRVACTRSDEDLSRAAGALRKTVQMCVGSWARCYHHILLRLSGGLDSSIVLSCLIADGAPVRITCINHYSAGSDSDERVYARLAATRAHRDLIERERDPSFRLNDILNVARTPKPSYYLEFLDTFRADAELASAIGASALFTGVGGDQLFLQNPEYWPAADYLRARGLDAGFPGVAMEAARLGRVSVWETIRLALVDRLRRSPANSSSNMGQHMALVKPEVVAAARSDQRFLHPALRSVPDIPPGKLAHIRQVTYSMEYYDPLNLDAAPEAVHPLWSQPVMELCLQLPTYVLANGGRSRALARQAFAQDVPPEIARRRSKGGMDEHLKTVLMRNRDFIRTTLLDGALVRQGLLDRAKLEEVLSGRPTAIASPLLEIALLMSVEAWLHKWRLSQQRAAA